VNGDTGDRPEFDELPALDFGDDAISRRRTERRAVDDDLPEFDFSFEDGDDAEGRRQPDAPSPDQPFNVITVCPHNRTRSVMSMAMLQAGFDLRLGAGNVVVSSLGFGPADERAIPDAIAAMQRRDLDVVAHRSRKVTADRVRPADLILTSEVDHVVKIVSKTPDVFHRTFTLPEFVGLAADAFADDGQSAREWIESLGRGRTATEYLGSSVPEVADPTGSSARNFEAATVGIEQLCEGVVASVCRHL